MRCMGASVLQVLEQAEGFAEIMRKCNTVHQFKAEGFKRKTHMPVADALTAVSSLSLYRLKDFGGHAYYHTAAQDFGERLVDMIVRDGATDTAIVDYFCAATLWELGSDYDTRRWLHWERDEIFVRFGRPLDQHSRYFYYPIRRPIGFTKRMPTFRDDAVDLFVVYVCQAMIDFSYAGDMVYFSPDADGPHVTITPEYEAVQFAAQHDAHVREKQIADEQAAEAARLASEADNRLGRVGEKYQHEVTPNCIDWKGVTPEQIGRLVYEYPTTSLAVMCGVSDVAIAKYCKKHGVQKPPRGYWAQLGR